MAGIVVTTELLSHLTPPVGHRSEWVGAVCGYPVELGRDVVDGAFFEPGNRVGKDAVVLPVACLAIVAEGLHAVAGSHRRARAGGAGGRDAESHPRLGCLNHIVDVSHHLVDVLAAPVAHAKSRARTLP